MYFIGPYLIGIGAAQEFNTAIKINPDIFLWLIFFTLPANLFIYGMNDIADTDTDTFNDKKGSYEVRIKNNDKKVVIISSIVLMLPFIPLFIRSSVYEKIYLIIFIIFGLIYSLPPIRLKAVPFVDSLSNGVLYTMAGLMGYFASGGREISWLPYIAGFIWASVMHAYSAIPDIESDKKAGIKTIATVLGQKNSIILCGLCYFLIAVILFYSGLVYHSLLIIPYLTLIILSFYKFKKDNTVFGIYKAYPYVTYVVGALVYLFTVNF
jgi:4-hydroxybenzoate polyprenyltransferase